MDVFPMGMKSARKFILKKKDPAQAASQVLSVFGKDKYKYL